MNIKNTALAAIAFVALYNVLFFDTRFGVGTGFLFLALNLYFFTTRNREIKNYSYGVLSSVISVLFAFLFSIRANIIVQVVNFLSASFFSLTALYFYKSPGQFSFQIPIFLLLPLAVIEKSVGAVIGLFQKDNSIPEEPKKDSTYAFIRGLIITIPVFSILLLLLTNADPIFGKLTRHFFSNIGERTIVSSILFIILMGFGLSKFLQKVSDREESAHIVANKSHELAVILGSILSLFAVFIIVQLKYLFSSAGEGELHQLGITSLTYSEYVRKGFFELLIASSIACGLIIYVFKYLHRLAGIQKLLIQTFSGILTVETALLLLSAVKRVALYADTHGLTRARVLGFIFLIWLAIILSIFLIRVFQEIKKELFFAAALISILLGFFIINIVNIDNLIAAKYKPTVNNEVDYYYIASLSTDASDSWNAGIADSQQIMTKLEKSEKLSTEDNRKLYWTKLTLQQFLSQTQYLLDKYDTTWTWQSLNFSEYFAYKSMEKTLPQKITTLLNRISQLEKRVSDDVKKTTPLDRSTQPPLL